MRIYTIVRRGLSRDLASLYIGIGTTFFDQLVAKGTFPPPVRIGGRKIWDIRDLDAAIDALKHTDDSATPNPWDS